MFRGTKFTEGLESSALPDTTSIGQCSKYFAKASWLDFLLETPRQKGLEGVEKPLVVVDDVVTTSQNITYCL